MGLVMDPRDESWDPAWVGGFPEASVGSKRKLGIRERASRGRQGAWNQEGGPDRMLCPLHDFTSLWSEVSQYSPTWHRFWSSFSKACLWICCNLLLVLWGRKVRQRLQGMWQPSLVKFSYFFFVCFLRVTEKHRVDNEQMSNMKNIWLFQFYRWRNWSSVIGPGP